MADESRNRIGLKPWYTYSIEEDIEFDIVAVHGLSADPHWTWVGKEDVEKPRARTWSWGFGAPVSTATTSSTGTTPDEDEPSTVLQSQHEVVWLRDFLPQLEPLEKSRVLGFGYQSSYLLSAPQRTVEALALEILNDLQRIRRSIRRPRKIIFICHCFGGIIVKEALIRATLDKQFATLRSSVHGIVFLGTPHRGTTIANYGDTILKITTAAGLGSDRGLVSRLKDNCEYLHRLASYFNSIYDDFEVFCFYELRPWRFGARVVEPESAVLDERKAKGLDTDHSGLNKFRCRDDPNFEAIANVLCEMAANARRAEETVALYGRDHLRGSVDWPYWKQASSLAAAVKERYGDIIENLEAHGRNTKSGTVPAQVHLSQCRFDSCTYTLGLADAYDTRRHLHPILDGHGGKALCESLGNLLYHLSALLTSITSDEDSFPSQQAGLQAATTNACVERLSGLLSTEDNQQVARHFQAKLVESNNPAYLESTAIACQTYKLPDQEAVAAMKRLQILIDQAESIRMEGQYLSVDFNLLLMNKQVQTYSKVRTGWKLKLAPLKNNEMPHKSELSKEFPVFVEWKNYTGLWSTEVGNTLFQRTELLTMFLKTAAKNAKLSILECVGYTHDSAHNLLGLVFRAPVPGKHLSLNNIILATPSDTPSLTDRFRLATILAESMFEVHSAGWLHKAFNSTQVIHFPETSAIASNSDDGTVDGKYEETGMVDCSITSPYIVGFLYSRPDRPAEFSEPGSLTLNTARYRHPQYKPDAMKKYGRIFDYYSLGVTLLEIALWRTVETVESKWGLKRQSSDAFRSSLVKIAEETLPSRVGTKYRDAVLACLRSELEFDRVDDSEREMARQLIKFGDGVVHLLRGCRA